MDYIAGILELIALYVVGCKNKFGFVLNVVVGAFWISHVCLSKGSYGLLIVVVPAIFINLFNYLKWKKNDAR